MNVRQRLQQLNTKSGKLQNTSVIAGSAVDAIMHWQTSNVGILCADGYGFEYSVYTTHMQKNEKER